MEFRFGLFVRLRTQKKATQEINFRKACPSHNASHGTFPSMYSHHVIKPIYGTFMFHSSCHHARLGLCTYQTTIVIVGTFFES